MRQSSKKKKRKEKIKQKFSKIFKNNSSLGIILSNIIFVIAVLWIFLTLGVEPPAATITAVLHGLHLQQEKLWALSRLKKKEVTDCQITPIVSEDITPTGDGLIMKWVTSNYKAGDLFIFDFW